MILSIYAFIFKIISSSFFPFIVFHGSMLDFIFTAIQAIYFIEELSPSPSIGYPTNERTQPGNVLRVFMEGTFT